MLVHAPATVAVFVAVHAAVPVPVPVTEPIFVPAPETCVVIAEAAAGAVAVKGCEEFDERDEDNDEFGEHAVVES